MPLAGLIIVAIIGILAGGVINVLADELPRRQPLRPPRYPDGVLRKPVAWLGISAFVTGNRVSPNGFELPWRHPLTELATAGLMIVAYLRAAGDPNMTAIQLIFWLVYMAIFVLITVIDIEYRLILFVVIIPSAAIAILDALITNHGPTLSEALLGGVLGFVVFFMLYLGGFLFTYTMGKLRGQEITEVAFGYGDVMLITLSGLILGWQALIIAMFITVFLGAFGALLYLAARVLMGNRYNLFTPLPYGPYIIAATLLMLLFAPEVTRILRG